MNITLAPPKRYLIAILVMSILQMQIGTRVFAQSREGRLQKPGWQPPKPPRREKTPLRWIPPAHSPEDNYPPRTRRPIQNKPPSKSSPSTRRTSRSANIPPKNSLPTPNSSMRPPSNSLPPTSIKNNFTDEKTTSVEVVKNRIPNSLKGTKRNTIPDHDSHTQEIIPRWKEGFPNEARQDVTEAEGKLSQGNQVTQQPESDFTAHQNTCKWCRGSGQIEVSREVERVHKGLAGLINKITEVNKELTTCPRCLGTGNGRRGGVGNIGSFNSLNDAFSSASKSNIDIDQMISGVLDATKKAGRDVSRESKKAIGDISREGKKVGGDIARTTKKASDDVAREAKKLGNDINREGRQLGRDIDREAGGYLKDRWETGKKSVKKNLDRLEDGEILDVLKETYVFSYTPDPTELDGGHEYKRHKKEEKQRNEIYNNAGLSDKQKEVVEQLVEGELSQTQEEQLENDFECALAEAIAKHLAKSKSSDISEATFDRLFKEASASAKAKWWQRLGGASGNTSWFPESSPQVFWLNGEYDGSGHPATKVTTETRPNGNRREYYKHEDGTTSWTETTADGQFVDTGYVANRAGDSGSGLESRNIGKESGEPVTDRSENPNQGRGPSFEDEKPQGGLIGPLINLGINEIVKKNRHETNGDPNAPIRDPASEQVGGARSQLERTVDKMGTKVRQNYQRRGLAEGLKKIGVGKAVTKIVRGSPFGTLSELIKSEETGPNTKERQEYAANYYDEQVRREREQLEVMDRLGYFDKQVHERQKKRVQELEEDQARNKFLYDPKRRSNEVTSSVNEHVGRDAELAAEEEQLERQWERAQRSPTGDEHLTEEEYGREKARLRREREENRRWMIQKDKFIEAYWEQALETGKDPATGDPLTDQERHWIEEEVNRLNDRQQLNLIEHHLDNSHSEDPVTTEEGSPGVC